MTTTNNLPAPTARPFKGTWLGRPGTSTEWRSRSSETSLRVVWHAWDDGVDNHVILGEGDGRYEQGHPKAMRTQAKIMNPTEQQVAELVAQLPQIWRKPSRSRKA